MKAEGEVVDFEHEGGEKEEEHNRGTADGSVSLLITQYSYSGYGEQKSHSHNGSSLEEEELEHGILAQPPLVKHEDHGQYCRENQGGDNATVVPGLGDAAPLQ